MDMDEPSKAANMILLGTGFGLILVSGFGLIQNRMSLGELGTGHIFLIAGITCILLSRLLKYETSRLSKIFPDESEDEMKQRIHGEINEIEKENSVGNAWAELESKVLTREIDQEAE
tara:strand:+ start:4000 stop:4350 length:351 start_codon:yes stop_codon:yes gene_type:complete